MSRLAGRRVALTRSAEGNARWAPRLAERGAVPVSCDQLVHEPCEGNAEGLRLLLPHADWLVPVSERAVRATLALGGEGCLAGRRVACVGEATAAAARAAGAEVELIAPEGTARSLAEALLARALPDEVSLALVARNGRPDLEEAFEAAGRRLASLAVHATLAAPTARPLPEVDAVLFASPSAVEVTLDLGPLPAGALVVAIGPTTAAALETASAPVHAVAATRDLEGCLEALESALPPAREPSTGS